MMKLLPTLLLGPLLSMSVYAQQLYVNEIVASNAHTLADGTGAYEDWFEIYNPNPTAIDIANYYVTDDFSAPTKSKLPTGSSQTIIPANGFLILWASGEPTRGPLHVNFKLSAGGESIGLYRPDGTTVVDQVTFGAQRTDISWGRKPDGSATWLFFAGTNISPGSSNTSKTGYPTALASPVFSQAGGFYTANLSLSITSPDPTATVYYTLDGSDPNPTNLGVQTFQYKNSYPQQPGQPFGPFLTESYQTQTYSGAIPISDRSSAPNKLSLKSSTIDFSPTYFPTTSLFKGTVVRALAYKANAIASDIITQTYFVTPTGASRYAIPVVSIATNEKNFFDYNTGIYTAGATFDNWRAANGSAGSDFCPLGNYSNDGDAWERPGNVEFFLNNAPIINQSAGLRINGNCTRSVMRKSLRLYGDSDFAYPFFANRPANLFYNRLILRNGGNDWWYSLITDAYMQTLARNLRLVTQSNRPTVMFVNGEYWGIHTLYERYDKYYFNRNYAIPTDQIDIVAIGFDDNARAYGTTVIEGDLVQYNTVLNYFNGTNPVSRSYVDTQIDVDNYTDYEISNIYAGNTDWPNNNQQLWRKRTSQYTPNDPFGQDGRFRWMLKDIDYGLSN